MYIYTLLPLPLCPLSLEQTTPQTEAALCPESASSLPYVAPPLSRGATLGTVFLHSQTLSFHAPPVCFGDLEPGIAWPRDKQFLPCNYEMRLSICPSLRAVSPSFLLSLSLFSTRESLSQDNAD